MKCISHDFFIFCGGKYKNVKSNIQKMRSIAKNRNINHHKSMSKNKLINP